MSEGFRGTPGKRYRPSNGTEGMMFEAEFCDQCNFGPRNQDDPGCPIFFLYFMDDEDNLPCNAWRYDSEGLPTCVAFWKKDAKP